MTKPLHIVIVGGGITGLVAAYKLQQQATAGLQKEIRVTLLEASERPGGKIQTIHFAGTPVDTGAEAVVLRDEGQQLFQELDLASELVIPKTSSTNIWTRGRLRPLPGGLVMGIPVDPFSIIRSGIISPPGILRAGMDVVLPRTRPGDDPTVQEIIGSRLGNEMVAHLIEPLLGGTCAGKADRLSLAALAPHILETAQTHRSLLFGLRSRFSQKQRGSVKKSSLPPLYSFADGLGHLVKRLHECLAETDIQLASRVQGITKQSDGTYHLTCDGGTELVADSVLLAIPAWEAARLLSPLDAESANELDAVEHASVMVTHLGYRCSSFHPEQLHGSGFIVPRVEGRLMNACTWVTKKWGRPGRSDVMIFRCSAGRAGDTRASQMNDQELVEAIHTELAEIIGIRERPVETRVTRWEQAFPQYNTGHQARVKRVEMMLAQRLPGIILAGAAYHGIGVAACMKDGMQAAQCLLDRLTCEQ